MIDSSTVSLRDALQLGRFEPARIQRQFQWRAEQVEAMMDDLLGAFEAMGHDPGEPGEAIAAEEPDEDGEGAVEAPAEDDEKPDVRASATTRVVRSRRLAPDVYFLGSMIFYRGRGGTFEIYDGLQRITSLTVLLTQLRDSWKDATAEDQDSIYTLLFDERAQRLAFPRSGRMLNAIMEGSPLPRPQNDSERNMREAAQHLRETFQPWTAERRRAFLGFLSARVSVNVIRTDNPTVAYQMFNGANARGLRLEVGDILKGVLAEQVRQNGGVVDQVDRCATIWRDAQLRLKGGFTEFLHAIEVLKGRPGERHTTGELLEDLFEDKPAGEICDWFASEFETLAAAMAKSREHLVMGETRAMHLAFRQLSFLGWREWQPFYLAVALSHKGKYDKPAFAREVGQLQKACTMVELLGWSEATRRRKFVQAIEQREAGQDPYAFRRDDNGALCLMSGNAKAAARRALRRPLTSEEKRGALVRWIETLMWGGTVPRDCTDDASVEHILPIAAMGEWQTRFTVEEVEAATHLLGNLCLIDKEVNWAIGNRALAEKCAAYEGLTRPSPRFPSLPHPSRTAQHALEASNVVDRAGAARDWNAAIVAQRTEALAAIAEKALGLAAVQKRR